MYEQMPVAKIRIAALGGLKCFCERCGLAFCGEAGVLSGPRRGAPPRSARLG